MVSGSHDPRSARANVIECWTFDPLFTQKDSEKTWRTNAVSNLWSINSGLSNLENLEHRRTMFGISELSGFRCLPFFEWLVCPMLAWWEAPMDVATHAYGCIYGGDAFMEVTQAGERIYPKTKTAQHGRRSYLLCIVIPLGSRIAGGHSRYLTSGT